MHNFSGFLHANGVDVESPEPFESGDVTTTKELFSLEVKKESKPVMQERANTLIATFLAAELIGLAGTARSRTRSAIGGVRSSRQSDGAERRAARAKPSNSLLGYGRAYY